MRPVSACFSKAPCSGRGRGEASAWFLAAAVFLGMRTLAGSAGALPDAAGTVVQAVRPRRRIGRRSEGDLHPRAHRVRSARAHRPADVRHRRRDAPMLRCHAARALDPNPGARGAWQRFGRGSHALRAGWGKRASAGACVRYWVRCPAANLPTSGLPGATSNGSPAGCRCRVPDHRERR